MVRLLVASTVTLAFNIYGTSGALTTVMVHLAHNTFTNQTVNVAAGDVVQFISLNPQSPFRVIQTSFSAPCRPLQNGFDSNLIFGTAPYSVNVSDLNPIWFYEDGSCTDGMVGAINAPTTGNTFDAFLAAARSLSPDGPPQPSSSGRPKSAARKLAIAGGTVGAVALCLVLVVIALLCRRRRHRVRANDARIAPIPPPPYQSPHRSGKSSVSSEAEPWRNETEDVRTELAQLRELVVTQLAPPPPRYSDHLSPA